RRPIGRRHGGRPRRRSKNMRHALLWSAFGPRGRRTYERSTTDTDPGVHFKRLRRGWPEAQIGKALAKLFEEADINISEEGGRRVAIGLSVKALALIAH